MRPEPLAPPIAGFAARVGGARDGQDGLRAAAAICARRSARWSGTARCSRSKASACSRPAARSRRSPGWSTHRVRRIRVSGSRGRPPSPGSAGSVGVPVRPGEVEVEVDGLRPRARICGGKMKLEAASTVPGFATAPRTERAVGEVDPDGLLSRQRAGVGGRSLRRRGTCRGCGEAGDGDQRSRKILFTLRATLTSSEKRGSTRRRGLALRSRLVQRTIDSGISSASTSSLAGSPRRTSGFRRSPRPRLARLAPSPPSPPISCSAARSASRSYAPQAPSRTG